MQGKKILIVGGQVERRVDIHSWLAGDRRLIVIQAVENGRIALEELAEVAPDLIVLDLEFPDIDGFEFVHLARATTDARIVVTSPLAPAGSARAAQALSLGADAVMSLPSERRGAESVAGYGRELRAVVCSLLGLDVSELI